MGGHPFLHLPAVGPAPQHQGKLSLASLIGSRNVLFKQSVAGSCIRSYLLPPPSLLVKLCKLCPSTSVSPLKSLINFSYSTRILHSPSITSSTS
jgi:hypothetical protein